MRLLVVNLMSTETEDSTRSILFVLGGLTAKVDALLINQKLYDQRHEALEDRVSILETLKAKVLGGALVVSTSVGVALNYFLK